MDDDLKMEARGRAEIYAQRRVEERPLWILPMIMSREGFKACVAAAFADGFLTGHFRGAGELDCGHPGCIEGQQKPR